jgi:hypothetical protein
MWEGGGEERNSGKIITRTKAYPNYAIRYNYAIQLLFSWGVNEEHILNSPVLHGNL